MSEESTNISEEEHKSDLLIVDGISSYKEGARTGSDVTIDDIIAIGHDYAVYTSNEDLYTLWAVENPDDFRASKLGEINTLFAISNERLKGIYNKKIDLFRTLAVTAVLQGQDESEINLAITNLRAQIETIETPQRVISIKRKSCIWIDHDGNPDHLSMKPSQEGKQAASRFQHALNYAESVLPNERKQNIRYKINVKVCNTLAAAEDMKDMASVNAVFDKIENEIKNIAENILKSKYLWLATMTTIILTCLSYIIYSLNNLETTLTPALIPIGGGFLGTYISVLARSDNIRINELNSDKLVLLQGTLRIIMGGVFGLLAYSFAESGLAFSLLSSSSFSLLILGVVAGFSERLIPELINNLSKTQSMDNV